jgi:adsorption protein B
MRRAVLTALLAAAALVASPAPAQEPAGGAQPPAPAEAPPTDLDRIEVPEWARDPDEERPAPARDPLLDVPLPPGVDLGELPLVPLDPLRQLYIDVLFALTLLIALLILISSLDDAFVDAYYWVRSAWRRHLVIGGRGSPMSLERLCKRPELPFAIMVPAWHEHDVIAAMVENTVNTVDYEAFRIFCGVYRNDPATRREVDRMVARFPGRVTRVDVPHDGPTSKADCLNWIVGQILAEERSGGTRFQGLVLHDCEDVVHPLELKLFNVYLPGRDLVQLPVFSLERRWTELVAATYMDDFAEAHGKDLRVREDLAGSIPGAGVATCYNRHGMAALWARSGGSPFNTASLTEDYDLSFRLRAMGLRQAFAHVRVAFDAIRPPQVRGPTGAIISTHEYFPHRFRAAVRQRARWVVGIAFQGWRELGWAGSGWERYFFFRDRKAIVMAPAGALAYVVLGNFAWVAALGSWELYSHVESFLAHPAMATLLGVNLVFMANRALQRMYFVGRYYGPAQALLSVLRMPVNVLINFFAVMRAWRLYVFHAVTGRKLAWDKTAHAFPGAPARAHAARASSEVS